ncbi:MAG TPA: vWA domain-containing protein, partial [Planctomycetaceae bacterium]|nr:vWA domain-containing protein [Planctomycetaceae bacterium]
GNAVLRVADDRGNMLGKAAGVSVALAAGDQAAGAGEQSISLSSARELADTIGTATALFRGHEFHDDLVIKTASGTTVESRPGRLHSAKIRLNGNRRQRAAVVFVLDCSFSMRQEMLFEGADARVPRLEVAKAALGRMLNALAARGDARVGVILYGHRIGWSTKEQNQLLTQTSYAGRIPEGLKPYEDVETVLPLGRFDAVAAAGVIERLDRVKPWGESPLYLALTQALQEFKDDDLDAQRSVVVITDGLNYQFNPRSEKAKAARDVLAADSLRGIPLHIVGFGIQPEEERQTQREFGQLAGETGGHFVNVAEAASLAESLEDILQARQYAVSTAAGKTQRARIGSAVEIEWADDGPQECLVSIDALSEPVEVAGGEALELFVSQDGQKIVSAVYDAGSPVFAALVGGPPRDPKGIRLGVHQPSREGSTVIFDLSLQHLQQHFVSRPREVWAEISPVLPDNRPAANLKYVFYDPEFVPRTAVPVLRAAARNWPKAARRARIDFWCKWSATEPSRLVAFADAPDGNQAAQSGTLEAIPGFKYQMRTRPGAPWRVDFIEIYPSDAAGATMLKIDVAGRVQPTRILRQFDDVNHFATHSFLFDDPAPELIRSTDSIRIVTRRRMFDDAQRLEILVSIEVPEQADTIPSFPPAN